LTGEERLRRRGRPAEFHFGLITDSAHGLMDYWIGGWLGQSIHPIMQPGSSVFIRGSISSRAGRR